MSDIQRLREYATNIQRLSFRPDTFVTLRPGKAYIVGDDHLLPGAVLLVRDSNPNETTVYFINGNGLVRTFSIITSRLEVLKTRKTTRVEIQFDFDGSSADLDEFLRSTVGLEEDISYWSHINPPQSVEVPVK